MASDRLRARLGLNVPHGWWPAPQLVKSFEAAGFAWAQVSSPPASVLSSPRECAAHARAASSVLATTGMELILHGPPNLRAGNSDGDGAFEGLLAYAAECGAAQVVYHARDLAEGPGTEDSLLAETRSLARLARRAERLGVTITLENLCPVYPGPERLGHSPSVLRHLVRRLSSPAVGLCLDLGHAHVVADLRHADLAQLVAPVLDSVTLFHVHDNLGSRRGCGCPAGLDPLRLDLHLSPGRGTVDWGRVGELVASHQAPLVLEVHPPHRPEAALLHAEAVRILGGASVTPAALAQPAG